MAGDADTTEGAGSYGCLIVGIGLVLALVVPLFLAVNSMSARPDHARAAELTDEARQAGFAGLEFSSTADKDVHYSVEGDLGDTSAENFEAAYRWTLDTIGVVTTGWSGSVSGTVDGVHYTVDIRSAETDVAEILGADAPAGSAARLASRSLSVSPHGCPVPEPTGGAAPSDVDRCAAQMAEALDGFVAVLPATEISALHVVRDITEPFREQEIVIDGPVSAGDEAAAMAYLDTGYRVRYALAGEPDVEDVELTPVVFEPGRLQDMDVPLEVTVVHTMLSSASCDQEEEQEADRLRRLLDETTAGTPVPVSAQFTCLGRTG